jgi:hypothetical protein
MSWQCGAGAAAALWCAALWSQGARAGVRPLPAALSPPQAMGRLKAAEDRVRSGVVRFVGTSRSARWEGEVDEAQARAELSRDGRQYGSSAGTLRFDASGWKEEGRFTSEAGVTTIALSGAAAGRRRSVTSAASHAHATISPDQPGPAGLANALLREAVTELLKEVPWKSSETAAGGRLLLKAEWQGRALSLVLEPRQEYRVVEARVITRRGGAGEADAPVSAVQTLRVEYQRRDGALYPARIEQLNVSRLGEAAHAVVMEMRIEEATLNGVVAPDSLSVAIPRGAEVTDTRAGAAVRYQQGERDLTLAEVRELAERREAELSPAPTGGPRLGAAAPGLVLKALDGKPARLEDYRGKVVLLNWFASW